MDERLVRMASSFAEAEEFDRNDLARLTIEERISAVESLRRVWFGEAPPESRPLYVIGRAELLANKRASGRAKDLRDVAVIEATPPSARKKASSRKRGTSR